MSKREEDHLLSCLYPAGFTGLSGGVSAEGSFWASPSPPLPGSGPSSSLLLEAIPSSACRTTSGGRSAWRGCCPTGQPSRAESPGITRGAAWCGAVLASSRGGEQVEGHKAIK